MKKEVFSVFAPTKDGVNQAVVDKMEKETINNFYGFLFVLSFKWDGLRLIYKYGLELRGKPLGLQKSVLDIFFNVLHAPCSSGVVNFPSI